MRDDTKEERNNALQVLVSTLRRCENIQPKFTEGTPQHSLLRNRIKALTIAKSLLLNESVSDSYTKEDLLKALPPLSSIISKCEKAQRKFTEGTPHYRRFQKMITAVRFSETLILDEIDRNG
ncbi:hypothetical protein [Anaeromassilibacillus senegalensis]|uniref:hypothetical protein n=1 Tax=Anaeromassilibacillus senegalensis TaxID=1673717 RepID=UPI00068038C0|nr:hypothetical protein [Anaeromassilibacillus senegalensis]